ncbi:efflux RND transporter periplasmic adaptor subunit [Dechloromonas agitata]|uniref:efflux RND transporter periplasmic adaptor subunit n=1 Tax=Dechloromonas agitata TaxID=73030 RepID=UPI000481C89D|nr:efflux RND transporter periplasmic adaptor subunit [Dechloromonas agitata]
MKITQPSGSSLGLGLLAAVLLGGFGLVVARSGPLAPTQVTVAHAEERALRAELFGIGTVEARRSYFIGPTAAGRLKAVHVDVGDRVKAGQLLAEIDPVDLDERLRSLEAAYARAQSAVSATEAQRKDMLARREIAGLNARRYRDLGDQHFVSASAVESRQQELTSAQAAVDATEANLQSARQELTRLKADQDALREQRQNLRLLAPRDGIVTSRDAEPGSTVIAGQAVIRLIEPDSLWVKVRFDQGRSRGLAVGQATRITLRSNPGQPLAGQVARIEPLSDSVTEERIAQVGFDQIPPGLSVGEMAEVTVETTVALAALALPNAAVKHTARGTGVWTLQDGKPAFTVVRLGQASLDGLVEVIDGIRREDAVIVHSERDLAPGKRIKVVEQLAGSLK